MKKTRKMISAALLVGLSSYGAFPSAVYDNMENEELAERHGFARVPVKLAVAIAAAEEATGAKTSSIQFADNIDNTKYTFELTAADNSSLIAEVDLSSYEVLYCKRPEA